MDRIRAGERIPLYFSNDTIVSSVIPCPDHDNGESIVNEAKSDDNKEKEKEKAKAKEYKVTFDQSLSDFFGNVKNVTQS